jgi:hypothetical protein
LVIGVYRRGRLVFYTKKTKNAKYLTINTSFILTQTIEKKTNKKQKQTKKPVLVAIQTFLNKLEPLANWSL